MNVIGKKAVPQVRVSCDIGRAYEQNAPGCCRMVLEPESMAIDGREVHLPESLLHHVGGPS